MLSKERSALLDIAANIHLARTWTSGLTLEAFAEDRKTFYAVTRCLEIISEASRRLDPDALDRAPNLPWREIRNAGNQYRHQYDTISERRVLTTVREYLEDLDRFVRTELER